MMIIFCLKGERSFQKDVFQVLIKVGILQWFDCSELISGIGRVAVVVVGGVMITYCKCWF